MRIGILGCGPTGLVAAHAAVTAGHKVYVFSRKQKSFIHGAQYLHEPIPDVPVIDPMRVRYVIQGDPIAYLKKVYDGGWDGSVSDELRGQEHLGWDMRGTYNWLWMTYQDLVCDVFFDAPTFAEKYEHLCKLDLVVNTLPRPALCWRGHQFTGTKIWAMGDAPEEGRFVPMECALGDIIYNGNPETAWARLSNIFGYKTVEWPGVKKPPLEGIAQVSKPVSHNCDCWPNLNHIGRYGTWRKGRLVHHAYNDVREMIALKEMAQ